jgi:hypothetical protein
VRSAATAAAPSYQQAAIELTCHIPDNETLVRADAVRLQQVLANLLDNALRHTRTRVDATLETRDDQAAITVTDDGEGIPADQLETVFHASTQPGAPATDPAAGSASPSPAPSSRTTAGPSPRPAPAMMGEPRSPYGSESSSVPGERRPSLG